MNYSDEFYVGLMKQFDTNQDGELSFEEFKIMMNNMVENKS